MYKGYTMDEPQNSLVWQEKQLTSHLSPLANQSPSATHGPSCYTSFILCKNSFPFENYSTLVKIILQTLLIQPLLASTAELRGHKAFTPLTKQRPLLQGCTGGKVRVKSPTEQSPALWRNFTTAYTLLESFRLKNLQTCKSPNR